MNDEMNCRFMAFKGDDEYIPATNVDVEITEFNQDGEAEIAFNAPFPGKPRCYLQINLAELLARIARTHGEKP